MLYVKTKVADPHHLNEDPDPAFHLNADPDTVYHFNAVPDPDPHPSYRKLPPLVLTPSGAPFF
jgi:hypothetical protein